MTNALTARATVRPGKEAGDRRPGVRRRRAVSNAAGTLASSATTDFFWFAAAALVWIALPRAAGAQPLTLGDAVRTALANNPLVEESRANAATARAGRTQVRGMGLPAIEIHEVALRTNSPADAFGLQLMQERFSFPKFTQSDPNAPDPMDNFATEVQATMPLFTGGKLRAARRGAGQMVTSADAMSTHTEAAIALATTKAFMNVALADRFVALARRAHATTQGHVTQAQDYFDAGMLVESDLLQAKVRLARMEENLITAENSAQLARAGLGQVMGVEQGSIAALDTTLADLAVTTTPLDSSIVQAFAARQDVKAMAAKTAAADAGVGRARGDYWPEVGVAAKYALYDDKLLGAHGDSYTLMAMARWTPWNWGETQGRVGVARGQRAAAVQVERAYRQQVEFEVRQARQGVDEARARLASTRGAVAAAERAMAILEDRFSQGIERVTELLDAETLAHEARVRETQAHFDMQAAIRTVRFATGQNPVPEIAMGGTTTR